MNPSPLHHVYLESYGPQTIPQQVVWTLYASSVHRQTGDGTWGIVSTEGGFRRFGVDRREVLFEGTALVIRVADDTFRCTKCHVVSKHGIERTTERLTTTCTSCGWKITHGGPREWS